MNDRAILVCGGGSIGRRHISNLKSLGARVSAWRARPSMASELSKEFDIPVFTDLDEALGQCDGVVVATSTDQHMAIAQNVARLGLAMYLEKPVSHNREGVDDLLALARDTVVEVGCQLRAHPNLKVLQGLLEERKAAGERILSYRFSMGQSLDQWRQGTNYQKSYSADASRGGGALFDLIHQIDLAYWLIGPMASVSAELSSLSDLELKADDLANVLITHEDGVVGHVQVDMVAPVLRCDMEIITTQRIYRWDYRLGKLWAETREGNALVDETPEGFERNDLFVGIMDNFLNRLDDETAAPMCSLGDGVAALDLVLAARKSYDLGQRVMVKDVT